MRFAFDFETYAFTPEVQIPPGVCMSYVEYEGPLAMQPQLVTGLEGVGILWNRLSNGYHIVGAETAFDFLVSVVTAQRHSTELSESLLELWHRAYKEDRVYDVFVRQKLIDLAADCYRYEKLPSGKWRNNEYSLAGLARRHTHLRLQKDNPWRLKFGELDGVPIEQYPTEASEYALEDALATALVDKEQDAQARNDTRIIQNFPGFDPLMDQFRQVRACVPLKVMSAIGLRTNPEAVQHFKAEVEIEHDRVREELLELGLIKRRYVRDSKAILARLSEFGTVGEGTSKATLERSGCDRLTAVAKYKSCKKRLESLESALFDPRIYEPAMESQLSLVLTGLKELHTAHGLFANATEGLVRIDTSRNTKSAQARQYAAYKACGRDVPHTESYNPKEHQPTECVALDADACAVTGDESMGSYADFVSLAKMMSNDIPNLLEKGKYYPIHTRFETILETGRTSSSNPNIQNLRRLPGIRECFVPRKGNVFIGADFGKLELHTLAQTCIWVLGFSRMAEVLNAGLDPHSEMAAKILRQTYEYTESHRDEFEVDNARTAGKGVNFGAPGGLGPATLAVYAWKNYGVRLGKTPENPEPSKEQVEVAAKELIQLFKDNWSEMPHYFGWVENQGVQKIDKNGNFVYEESKFGLRPSRAFNIVQPWSGRLRAGATYCSACNSPFQGLGSDVAKLALWYVWEACYGLSELGKEDPLYGCLLVGFVHDDIMLECVEARAPEAAERLAELMCRAGREVLPDVPVKADPVVFRQWSKLAKTWRENGKTGRLIPWDIYEAARKELLKAETDDKAREKFEACERDPKKFLLKLRFPSNVVEKVVNNE